MFYDIIQIPWPSVFKTTESNTCLNPFKPEFPIVIFIHYKPRIAIAILTL